ncbi:S26 family signal peptidase [Bradyrhizobium sp. CER78]|uniref:S26 family signal peptidase n=1 Tax=Bradyrhizobium sp. CER78 TaxID=3039162 RepID=UPI002449AC94|nr:S26 family signal peptidase [Bradyrhizobium sp. CER78]MDH2380725.1 S26 family signal peptidase [Bradyrhizobium sp. CER78]
MLAVISVSIVATIVASAPHAPLVVYNGSGSAPLGFYRLENRLPERGEMAVIEPPALVELMLVARGLLPPSVPLIKQIAAAGGDEVCRSDEPNGTIAINGKVVAETFEKGRDGRALPAWKGCMRLIEGEFFLLQAHSNSFDSRYFGPVLRCNVLGVARPIWTWNPDN